MILLAGLSALVSACETAVRGTEQSLTIETVPSGASIQLSDGQRCTSPCTVTALRYQVLTAHISRPDCRSTQAEIAPAVAGHAPLYGSVYDYQLGGAYDLEPNPLRVTLVCGAEARQPPPGLTPEDVVLLRKFGVPSSPGGAP